MSNLQLKELHFVADGEIKELALSFVDFFFIFHELMQWLTNQSHRAF